MKLKWLAPMFALGIVVCVGGGALAGYYVDDTQKQPPIQPECPKGYLPGDLIGVMHTSNGWEPVYSCLLDDPSGLTYVQPSPQAANATVQPK